MSARRLRCRGGGLVCTGAGRLGGGRRVLHMRGTPFPRSRVWELKMFCFWMSTYGLKLDCESRDRIEIYTSVGQSENGTCQVRPT